MNESNSGMMTKIWGPPGWVFLHCVVMGYPSKIDKKDKNHIKRMKETKKFFESMAYILPCRYCRESYQQYIKELPIKKHLKTRKKLAKWLYDIHNKVNKKLDVKENPSFKSIYDRYESYRATCTKTVKVEKGCIHSKHGSPKKCIINIEDDLNKLLSNDVDFKYKNMNFKKDDSGVWLLNVK